MNDYRYAAPRAAFALAAVAMAALTMGVFVALPSRVESDGQIDAMLAASQDIVAPCVSASPQRLPAPGEDVE